MMPLWAVWLGFAVCAGTIAVAGTRLSRYGDAIATHTGLGGGLIGLVLMATVTSLPELITGITAVALANVPDIAVGNVLGACVMNLSMIVLLDYLHRNESVYTRASHGHILSAAFGSIMLGLVAINLLLAGRGITLAWGSLGAYTPLILISYLLAVRIVYQYETRQIGLPVAADAPMAAADAGNNCQAAETANTGPAPLTLTLRQALHGYALAALVVVVAALALPYLAEQLALQMGWNQSFVGTLLVSLATTLPEITVTVAALRLGAVDMAIGNLFGSNLFNLALIGIDDLFYTHGPLLSHVSPVHATSALAAMVMSALAIAGLLYRPKKNVFGMIAWVSLLMAWVYVSNATILYRYGS